MKRVICNVASGHYAKGQQRLIKAFDSPDVTLLTWTNSLPLYSPKHQEVPYAFKAHALKAAADLHNADTLLWVDACIVPGPRPLADLWERIETEGYWISNNGWSNYEWTADSAYPDLFPNEPLATAREINRGIPHVVATAFGLSMRHPIGRNFLAEYLRLAQTNAFKGPWWNSSASRKDYATNHGAAPCGPPDVHGHRHDQTAASVIAWRLGMKLTNAPEWFSYAGGETEQTVLIADGKY